MLYINLSCYSESDMLRLQDWGKCGMNIDICEHDCDASLHLIEENGYSLTVINMNGKPKEGLELCGRIRRISRLPIIVIEDAMKFAVIRKALQLQVSDYLPSTLPAEELVKSVAAIKANHHRTEDDVIHRVKEYVGKMLHENITLKDLSSKFHFNRSYLGQKFKNHENMSFNEYLLIQRMERAKILLEQTDLKVYEIAYEVGYTEIDWFYKRFKSYTGVSANEYRKMVAS
ncbi:helix-turn-helix domain-containing protein [Paenibacillus sp. FSL H8-0457]|uniref:helix-turn-helix transcriptional regulator n=1 Tax=Paenibacillus TaxID=44249 RepID=UPI000178A140|nr:MULTISPECIES: helix-turn-helix domain-containing protein [Paenibacillus]ACX65553.1 two component transcriptional regulator, AraC family [Paenibacillus sp. Y412MC10]ETT66790.1 two component AraC family transcriptional regulator [Paenibacillus sp. FSL H8-457]MCM3258020.1 helix-turn-helix domain-containing protein [Paenibacillus lautus]